MTHQVNRFKQFYYGAIPYFCYRIFHPKSPKLECFQFIRKYTYAYPFLYDFIFEYEDFETDVHKDINRGLKYVVHKGSKKLYFPGEYTDYKIQKLYRSLVIEQDIRSPHHYVDSIDEFSGKVLLDIGSAEGIVALEAIDMVDFVYLFECELRWIEPLKATFEPWKDKIQIVRKYVSDYNDETTVTLDDFLKDKPKDHLFLKMDIEGAERQALAGGRILFSEATDLQFAICTYHKRDDVKVVSSFLDRYNCKYFLRKGLLYRHHKMRPCLIRGSKV